MFGSRKKLRLTDEEFKAQFEAMGATAMAKLHGVNERNVYYMRKRIEERIGRMVPPNGQQSPYTPWATVPISDGTLLVGGDVHIWPGPYTTAMRGFVAFANRLRKERSLRAIILNGDVIDGAGISRHPPIGWDKAPSVREEIDAAQDFLGEVAKAGGKVPRIWTLGNHDARFEMKLASVAPEFRDVHGISLKDHFPDWEPAWAALVGGEGPSGVVVKHRYKGGVHATHNNTLASGRTIVTNHLHSLKVTPYTDYNGTRWGVDAGTLADPRAAAFSYTEANPLNWRPGFVVLTWRKGRLLTPEMVPVHDDDHVEFRGELIEV